MKTIDRLITKAKEIYDAEHLILGFIYQSETSPGKWTARGDICGGKEIKSQIVLCDTEEEAKAALRNLEKMYPGNEGVPIIVDDIKD